jgi:hypothetical protein
MTLPALAVEDFNPAVTEHGYGPQSLERRRAERHRRYETCWLTTSSTTAALSSFLGARLVDASACGFGLCTREPVEPGHEYAIAGSSPKPH